MELHYQLSDREFATQFADCSFTPQWFTHQAHLRLAYIHLQQNTPKQASLIVCEQIRHFDITFDKGDKFHWTLTEASVYVLHHFMQRKSGCSFQELLDEFPRLVSDFKNLLLSHYSTEVLFGEDARIAYQAPDLLVF